MLKQKIKIHKTEIKESFVSLERIVKYGEVYTSEREVNAMLDLVRQETERIDSRFLEPACGNGNFLREILKRKLSIVSNRYSKSQIEFERYSFVAVSSVYGIDILEDNIEHCRNRLFDFFYNRYYELFTEKIKDDFIKSLKFVLHRNLILGDALSLKKVGLMDEPIIFSEWSLVFNGMVQRRDFKMQSLLENQRMNELNLFSDLGDEAFIPVPVRTYPLQNLYQLSEDVQYEL